ncbi:class I SAM-dependent RNA methyltransferase [Herbiconiux sp. L3-i23]|uniref:class I SAM-dependent RNA methyltransferase n=1 Tax=Herbiconiux sp. L3-i23 TaxID=2905871 RepID=UPI002072F010|nr:class I SAM-dependent RNA methyltransferase [Herbiconiux sp. L3-i23]
MSASSPTPADTLELEVTNIAHGGVAVARHEGRVVFVADTLPGERVLARVADTTHDRFWRAETVRVLDASADRQDHVWSAASVQNDPDERPGGAEFGHIRLDRQRALKRDVLVDGMRRFGGVDDAETSVPPVEPVAGRADGTGWRTRIRLHVSETGEVGPFAARSHRVIPVADLPLAENAVAAAAPTTVPAGTDTAIEVIATSAGDVRVLGDGGSGDRAPVVEKVGDRAFRLAAGGFWQVHTAAARTLTDAVGDALDVTRFDADARNLDLYGGVGLLAAAVADRFDGAVSIETVEADRRATSFAAENLADVRGARATTARVDRFLNGLERRSSDRDRDALRRASVVLDPPRSGAGREVMASLGRLAPAQLVYVACDPIALARDTGYAAKAGYRLASLRAFDLFPHTHHLEAVATFVRD